MYNNHTILLGPLGPTSFMLHKNIASYNTKKIIDAIKLGRNIDINIILRFAAKQGLLNVILWSLYAGADVNLAVRKKIKANKNDENDDACLSPIELARKYKHPLVEQILTIADAKTNQETRQELTIVQAMLFWNITHYHDRYGTTFIKKIAPKLKNLKKYEPAIYKELLENFKGFINLANQLKLNEIATTFLEIFNTLKPVEEIQSIKQPEYKGAKEKTDLKNSLALANNALMEKDFCLLNEMKEPFLEEALKEGKHDLVTFSVIGYGLEPLKLAISHRQNSFLKENIFLTDEKLPSTRERLIYNAVNRKIEKPFPSPDPLRILVDNSFHHNTDKFKFLFLHDIDILNLSLTCREYFISFYFEMEEKIAPHRKLRTLKQFTKQIDQELEKKKDLYMRFQSNLQKGFSRTFIVSIGMFCCMIYLIKCWLDDATHTTRHRPEKFPDLLYDFFKYALTLALILGTMTVSGFCMREEYCSFFFRCRKPRDSLPIRELSSEAQEKLYITSIECPELNINPNSRAIAASSSAKNLLNTLKLEEKEEITTRVTP